MSQPDAITETVMWMTRRTEEDMLMNPHLEELEGRLLLKIQERQLNCAQGDAELSSYKKHLAMELLQAVSKVTKMFGIDQ